MNCRASSTWLAALALTFLAASCGGAAAPADRAATEQRSDESRRVAPDDTVESPGDDADEPAASARVARCDDGSCFSCGRGICLKGFFCDERAVGGAACSWLPSCPAEPSCACVKRALGASCSCEERAGGIYVSC